MFLHVCKYGLQDYLKIFLSDDVSIKYSLWKKRIKSLVWSYETAKWNATCMLYPELDMYRNNIESIGMHMWWKFVVDNPIYMEKASAVLSIICSHLKSSVLTTPTSALAPLHIRQVTVQVAMGSKVDPLRRPI